METEFLTNDELHHLTGVERKSAQIKWLKKCGWKFIVNAAGFPVVSRMYCRAKMSSDVQVDDLPNFGAVM